MKTFAAIALAAAAVLVVSRAAEMRLGLKTSITASVGITNGIVIPPTNFPLTVDSPVSIDDTRITVDDTTYNL